MVVFLLPTIDFVSKSRSTTKTNGRVTNNRLIVVELGVLNNANVSSNNLCSCQGNEYHVCVYIYICIYIYM